MTRNVITTAVGSQLHIKCPRSLIFNAGIKLLGGFWDVNSKQWIVKSAVSSESKALLHRVFGENGDEPEIEYVNIDVSYPDGATASAAPIEFAGRIIAQAWGRDSGAKQGDSVAFLAGRATSGGSVKNWSTSIYPGSIVRIIGIPAEFAANLAATNPNVIVNLS